MLTLTRIVVWLNTGENAMWIYIPVLAPLFAVCVIGMLGSGSP